jgi:hypothetical protein
MISRGKLILPGDKGFRGNVSYPWHKLRRLFGLQERLESDSKIDIHGWFVKDNRVFPPMAIFKNCHFQLIEGTSPKIDEIPIPFSSLGEAYSYMKSLTSKLSISDSKKFSIAALSPDPGVFHPRPNLLFPTKDEFKK